MFDHTKKSRARLRVEGNLSALVMCVGALSLLFDHFLIGVPLFLACAFYSGEISKELKSRSGPLLKEENALIFKIDAIGFSAAYIAFIIWLFPIRSPAAWCLFALATFATPIVIYACWASAFSDTPIEPEK